jgi:protease IV
MANEREPGRFRRLALRSLAVLGAISLLFLALGFVLLLAALRGEGVPGRVILELDLERGLVEYVPDDPFAAVLSREALSVRDVVEALQRGAGDRRVVGLVTRVGSGGLGLAQVEEVRAAVTAFRASGKPAILFSETFGEFASGHGGYYLATAFDSIFLQPSGDVGLAGLISENPFLRGSLERAGVEPRMDHRYEYKNALNLFTEEEMTEPHREAVEGVLRSFYEQMVAGIAAGRGLDPAAVRAVIDNGPYFGDEAVRAGLVDRVAYRDEVYDSLRARIGGDPEFLYLRRYLRRAGRPHTRGPAVALIYGTGTVQRGRSEFDPMTGGSAMGSETVTRAFRDAVEDDDVRAIVFRIDSPGGSPVASDAIWRETVRAREAGKPVVVSMGNVAASGGYYVAAAADRIIAQPSTITGSIGVLGGKFLITGLTDRLGVTWGDVQVGGNATMWSAIRDYSPQEWERLQAMLDRIYAEFTGKVAQGRNLPLDSVHAVARGRVWSGVDAHRLGLVDELGGLDLALLRAREAAGLAPDAPFRLRVFPRERTLLEMVLDRSREGDSSYPVSALAPLARTLETLRPLLLLARQAGLLGDPGLLTMPPMRTEW